MRRPDLSAFLTQSFRGPAVFACAALAAFLSLTRPAQAALPFVDAVSTTNCAAPVFPNAEDDFLDVYDGSNRFTAWGVVLDQITRITSSNDHMIAIVRGRVAASDQPNACPDLGSVTVELVPSPGFRGSETTVLTFMHPLSGLNRFLRVRMHSMESNTRWGTNLTLRNCVRDRGGDLVFGPDRAVLALRVPQGRNLDECGRVRIDAALAPNPQIEARLFDRTWEASFTALSSRATAQAPACTTGGCAPSPALEVEPDWAEIAGLPVGTDRALAIEMAFSGNHLRPITTLGYRVQIVAPPSPPPPPPPRVIVTTVPTGGHVESASRKIDCGTGLDANGQPRNKCDATFTVTSVVDLTAVADPGFAFTGWGGDCAGTSGESCQIDTLAIADPQGTARVSATFAPRFELLVTVTGNGSAADPSVGISCGAVTSPVCSVSLAEGTPIVLTANRGGGTFFAGWEGCPGVTGLLTCSFTMPDRPVEVGAVFQGK